jgi:hypothetical protein
MNRKESLVAGTALGVMLAMGLAVVLPGVGLQTARAEDQALADTFFKVDWAVSPGNDGKSKISGFVYNNFGSEADQVELLITALDASGHPIRTSIEQIGDVPALDRVSFELAVPGGAASYRVAVNSWNFFDGGK